MTKQQRQKQIPRYARNDKAKVTEKSLTRRAQKKHGQERMNTKRDTRSANLLIGGVKNATRECGVPGMTVPGMTVPRMTGVF